MRIGSRQTQPSEGWFQIGDAPEQLSRPRRGCGRVSLVADAERDDRESGERFVRKPLLERANTAAEAVLSRVIGLRHGALALCAAVLVLVALLLASRISAADAGHRAVNPAASAAQLHRDRAQIAQLSTELRSSRQKLQAAQQAPNASQAPVRARHSRQSSVRVRHRPRPPQRAKHRSREGGR